jgi:hypothetical protein
MEESVKLHVEDRRLMRRLSISPCHISWSDSDTVKVSNDDIDA